MQTAYSLMCDALAGHIAGRRGLSLDFYPLFALYGLLSLVVEGRAVAGEYDWPAFLRRIPDAALRRKLRRALSRDETIGPLLRAS